MPAFVAQGASIDNSNALRVYGPADCCVAVYQHPGFSGWKAVYGPGEYNFEHYTRAGAFEDASSIKVKKGGCDQFRKEQTSTTCYALLYQHGNFDGWEARFTVGSYNFN
jgi:hypothetical protein